MISCSKCYGIPNLVDCMLYSTCCGIPNRADRASSGIPFREIEAKRIPLFHVITAYFSKFRKEITRNGGGAV
jgi:hypothetical protein